MLDVMVSSWLLHLFYEGLTYITTSDAQIWNKAKIVETVDQNRGVVCVTKEQ